MPRSSCSSWLTSSLVHVLLEFGQEMTVWGVSSAALARA